MIASKKLDRYNDDFGLYFNGVDDCVFVDDVFNEISNSNDWGVSFFINREENLQNCVIFDSRPLLTNEGGIILSTNEIGGGKYQITLGNGFGGASSLTTTFTKEFLFGNFYNILLDYKTGTDELSFYVNSVKTQTINLGARIITPTNSSYSAIGSIVIPVGTNYFSFKGMIRDFNVFDKSLNQSEASYLYDTGIIPTSSHSNNIFNLPLNGVPSQKNNLIRSTDILDNNTTTTKILFNKTAVNGSSFKAELLVSAGNPAIIGFKTQNTSANDLDRYLLFVANGLYGYSKNGSTTVTGISAVIGDILEGFINGTNIEFKVNGTIITTYAVTGGGGLSALIPYASARISKVACLDNVTWDGVQIDRSEILTMFNRASFGDLQGEDISISYNATTSKTLTSLMNWTDAELGLGVGGLPSSTTYRGWESKNNYIPTNNYKTGLNITNLQSITINGLTIGDKLIVNYDEIGVRKQDVISVNAVNYTYTPTVTIKIRLITVLKDGFYASDKVYKTIFNNGLFRSGIESSYTDVINAETNLKSPFDDAGTLKFPDLSTNSRVIIANGYTDLSDLQANIN